MAVKSYQGLAGFDESLYGNAADMRIERHMIDEFAIESGVIEIGVVWRSVEQHNGFTEIIAIGEIIEVLGNCGITDFIFGNRYGAESLIRGNATGIDIGGDIVTLPVFKHEGSGRHIRIAVNVYAAIGKFAIMGIMPETIRFAADEILFFITSIIIAQDDKDIGVAVGEGITQSRKLRNEIGVNKIA